MKGSTAAILFPHQLFRDNPLTTGAARIFLVEEFLFFRQYRFHKQKLAFHRASMKTYGEYLEKQTRGEHRIDYIESADPRSDVRQLIPFLRDDGVSKLCCIDPADDWLEQRIRKSCRSSGLELTMEESPMFLLQGREAEDYFIDRKQFRQTDFYIRQRKKFGYLTETGGQPQGGKWTFDTENREKYPRDLHPPEIAFPKENRFHREAKSYVEKHFPDNYGELDPESQFPLTPHETLAWLDRFLEERFEDFGRYQDAMVSSGSNLHHSLISPMLNVGLLTPAELLDRVVEYGTGQGIPLNSLEGYLRQVLGWREFLRGVYLSRGRYQRSRNYWEFSRKIPHSFWEGTTGIEPVDLVIRKVLQTGYAHHIERLMVLGNFMLLCEFDPDEVYRWFMELFIDAYDWVMVPNVYGMSQYADGGLMSTKPYISSSNYLRKMSDFEKGPWQEIWDALFWRFLQVHRDVLSGNPRLRMLLASFDKMSPGKRSAHLEKAELYLNKL